MARRIRSPKLEDRTSRLTLKAQKGKPHWVTIGKGLSLGFRKNKTPPNMWVGRKSDGKGGNTMRVVGPTDDFENTPGALDFWQAQAKVRELFLSGSSLDPGKPITVLEAVRQWKAKLEAEEGDPGNATRIERHLAGTVLADMIVAGCVVRDWEDWKFGLVKKGLKPGAVTRNSKSLARALTVAASRDDRIRNAATWREGLASLPGSTQARRAILKDAVVCKIIATAAQEDAAFQTYVEVLAVCGCRPSQARRLLVGDLLRDKVMIPRSRKGRNKRHSEREPRSVPIPPSLAAKLRHMAAHRPAEAPLLLTATGKRWGKYDHRWPMHRTAERAGLDPAKVTIYALRHSSIVRQLLKGVPVAIVSDHHDTSEPQIRSHYAKYISEHTDEITRAAMLDVTTPAADNVVPMR
jgi:integrase